MASKTPRAGSKRPQDFSTQVKFLINIPLLVESETDAKIRCDHLLNSISGGFKEEDRKFIKEKNGKNILDNVAVIFGMNGKHTPDLLKVLKNLESYRFDSDLIVRYSIITYTWGQGGTIAQDASMTPYRHIREHLKNSTETKKLVEELRGNDKNCLVYFSFIDSDTFSFNSIYSEYIQIVEKELQKDSIPPTVMSTGYEFTHEKPSHIASDLDRMIRAAIAEVSPLLVYYPEPNFCVLVREGLNGIEESFMNQEKKKNNMESAVLIRQVKTRPHFKAVFFQGNPIIILVPKRFKQYGDGLKIGQSTLEGRNLAIGAYCNQELTCKETYNGMDLPNDRKVQPGTYYKNRNFIMDLYKCENDEKFEELSKKNPFLMDGKEATILVDAIREARECRKFIEELNRKMPEDE